MVGGNSPIFRTSLPRICRNFLDVSLNVYKIWPRNCRNSPNILRNIHKTFPITLDISLKFSKIPSKNYWNFNKVEFDFLQKTVVIFPKFSHKFPRVFKYNFIITRILDIFTEFFTQTLSIIFLKILSALPKSSQHFFKIFWSYFGIFLKLL